MNFLKFTYHLQSPKTLKESCLVWISKTLPRVVDRIRESHSGSPCRDLADKNINNMDECLSDVRDLFVDVPSLIIQLIIGKISVVNGDFLETKGLWKNVLSVLLCKPIQGLRLELKLSHIDMTNLEEVFKLIKESKTELTVLRLVGSVHNIPLMKMYIRDLPSLTHLAIQNCDDSVLETVGASCPNLKSLRLNTSRITSRGLKSLCLNPNDLTKRCQKLKCLKICAYRFSYPIIHLTDGLVALLLGLPQLERLECDYIDMGEVLRLAQDNDQQQDTQLKIQKITYTHDFCQQFHPVHMPKLCPHLKTLTLTDISSDNLASFPVLATLREVTFIFICMSEFEQGVVPFLQKNGKFIQVLRFREIEYVNYNTVDQLCTNLEKLQCIGIHSLLGWPSADPLFNNLESLRVDFYPSRFFEMNLSRVSQLASKCHNLRHLWIHSKELIMSQLVYIFTHNPFRHLVSIHFESDTLSITGETSDATSMSPFLDILCEKYDSALSTLFESMCSDWYDDY